MAFRLDWWVVFDITGCRSNLVIVMASEGEAEGEAEGESGVKA